MIDYSKIAESIKHYEMCNFIRIETPWLVPTKISNITKPTDVKDFYIPEFNKSLVASGEQSFLCSIIKGRLPFGLYQTVPPCFRDDENDTLHHKYFIKNELIRIYKRYDPNCELDLQIIIQLCKDFFSKYLPSEELEVIKTPVNNGITLINFDILFRKIELGSYGIRKYQNLNWIYATGCAEPRLTTVCEMLG